MKKLITAFSFLLLIACGGSGEHGANSPMVAPVDKRVDEEVKIHAITINKTDALKIVDDMEVLSAKVNGGTLPYTVGEKIGMYVETTTYFADEAKTQAKMVKLIGVGNGVNAYFLDEKNKIIEQNGFVYIFQNDKLTYVMTEGESVTGLSENNKNEITSLLKTAEKVAKTTQTSE